MDSINNLHPKMQAYSPFPMAQTNYYTPLFGQNSYAQNSFAYENNNYNQQYQTQNNFQKYEFLARDVFIQGLNLSQDNLYSAMIVLIPNRPNMNNNNYQAHQMLNDSLFQQYVAQECLKTQKFYQNNNNKFNNINCENLMQNQMKEQQQQQYQKDINYNQLQNLLQNNNNINAKRKVSSTVENDSNNQQQVQKNDANLQKNKNLVETKSKKQIKVKQEDGQQTESNEDIYEISEYSQSSTTKTIINTALNQNNSNSNLQLIQSQQINEQKNMPKQESSEEQVIHESFDTDCTNQTQSLILKNDINQQKVQNSDNDNNINNNINNGSIKDNKASNEANNLNQFGSFLNNIQNLQGQYQNLLGTNNLNINHIDILQQIGLEEPVDDMNNSQSGKKRKSKFDTKNLVKNFLNSFYSFIQSQEEEQFIVQQMGYENKEPVIQIRNQLKEFFKGKKFNRDLLKEFMFESIFRPHFLLYLEKRAPEWIEKGRMKDKASHWRALKNYTFVCTNYEKIKSWRFRYNFV